MLLPQKAIWEADKKCLIIADLHLGKIEHFRASGIGLPQKAVNATLEKLKCLLNTFEPQHVIFLGDLFHSRKNDSFKKLSSILKEFENTLFTLITGNHDILTNDDYTDLGLSVYPELVLGNLWLTHEPQKELKGHNYNLAGHIHPGVRLNGKGKQSISLPCFYFGDTAGILPAFGYFTGKAILKPDRNSKVFVIAEDLIYNVSL